MPVDPGKFVHRVFLYNPIVQPDGKDYRLDERSDAIYDYNDSNGGPPEFVTVPTPVRPQNGYEIRALIEPILGRELVIARGIKADLTLKCKTWYTNLLSGLTRIYWYNGFKWVRIEVGGSITPDYTNREMWFYGCEFSR